jgi:hypothetical protein
MRNPQRDLVTRINRDKVEVGGQIASRRFC